MKRLDAGKITLADVNVEHLKAVRKLIGKMSLQDDVNYGLTEEESMHLFSFHGELTEVLE